MKTHISRQTFAADKRYAGIYQQMGRMLTDADWNELSDIDKNRLAQALTDVIGSGTPRSRGLVESSVAPDGTHSYALKWGHAYVDGIGAQIRPAADAVLTDPAGSAFEYPHQADFPEPPPLPASCLLYLDVWERTVTALEDSDIVDPGLQGADTCTRTQTMAQVKWCAGDVDPEDSALNPAIGTALLNLELRAGSTEVDPCDPCAEEIALQDKVGNYLFRVEIHAVDYDAVGAPERVTLKWSSENGAEQYVIDSAPRGFEADHWCYEFFNGSGQKFASEKHLGRHLASGFVPARGELFSGYPDPVPSGQDLVRRWDGFCILEKSGSDWLLVEGSDRGVVLSDASAADAHGHVAGGSHVIVNFDAITADIALDDAALLAGDFWQVEVRQAIHVAGDTLLVNAPPLGILHHYMTLGTLTAGVFTAFDGPECQRFEFPPLTDIKAKNVCYNNDTCSMPEVETVQQAIDYLCRQKDLRWHHKHLHGWGIVCGLIVECCRRHDDSTTDEEVPVDADGDSEAADERLSVCVTPGHALTCDGDTLSLSAQRDVPVIEQIQALEEAGVSVLSAEGNGTVCLRLDSGADGQPQISVEPYDAAAQKNSPFDGTLLMDFYQHCVLDLVEALREETRFLSADELEEVEGGATGLVSVQRRKFISLINLLIQLVNSGNGAYVFLSAREHRILRAFYLQLRDLLASKTFCAMFQGDEFPDYPFDDIGMTTFFGKNSHTRAQIHPDGKRIYTYGGTDNSINVYDVDSERLIEVLQMPSAEGAEVTALAINSRDNLLYAVASVRQTDTVSGIARIGDVHKWEDMTILCNITITDMVVSEKDPELIYALGLGKGLYFFRPALFADEVKPQPTPTYGFNACGQMKIDQTGGLAYCTATTSTEPATAKDAAYNQVAVCNLGSSGENQAPQTLLALRGPTGAVLSGRDGIEIAGGDRSRLYLVVDAANNTKQLLTYATPVSAQSQPLNTASIEDTGVSLAFHAGAGQLLLGFEDGYRLQLFNPDGVASNVFRVPVQILPMDIRVEPKSGDVYVLNFISNTLSRIPQAELAVSAAFLDKLAAYRTDILQAFYALFGSLLQYLKDCFCHHLLIKCPTCNEDDILYLATVEIRDRRVYKICNFEKRKYVKTFRAVDYWWSAFPFAAIIKSLVSQFCCSVIPDFLGQYKDKVIIQPKPVAAEAQISKNRVSAQQARTGIQTFQRTDSGLIFREQTKSLNLAGVLVRDSATNMIASNQTNQPGLKKQALLNSSVDDAVVELERNNIQVAVVEEYDASKSNQYLSSFTQTPQRIKPGSEVTVVQKDGKVLYYGVKEPAGAAEITVPDSVREEIAALETRKTNLADLSQVEAGLANVEARKASVSEIETLRTDLSQLQTEKASVEAEIAQLNSQVDSIRTARIEEEAQLTAIANQRTELSADIAVLNQSLNELEANRKTIALAVETQKPITNLAEVDRATDAALKEAGVFTVGDLANTTSRELTASTRIDANQANLLINAAKLRLKQ